MNLLRTKLLEKLQEKLNETLRAVLPVIGIVLMLCFTVAPIEPGILLAFLMGAVLLIVGMMFFTLGVEMSMTPMGENVGTCMTKTKKLWLMVLLSFILGFIVTISEPDLQVLAEQVPSVPNMILVLSVAFGVGIFLVAALLRMLFNITLSYMLIGLYAIVFILAFFVPKIFTAIAFDSGGVASGPMTATFLLPFAMGACEGVGGNIVTDAFGVVAMTPLITIQILGLVYQINSRHLEKKEARKAAAAFARLPDNDIIEL